MVNLFERPAYWYLIVAILVSAYQGGRGVVFQLQFAETQRSHQKKEDASTFALGAQSKTQMWLLRAIADGLLYSLTTLAGFASLLLAYRILDRVPSIEGVSGGTATIFVFLSLSGMLGVTGQLPHLLQQGKWPR